MRTGPQPSLTGSVMSTRPSHSSDDARKLLVEDLLLEVAEDEEERDEDRDLEDDRKAGGVRVDLVLLVELHELFRLPLTVRLVALLDRLHLGRVDLQALHRVDLPDRDRDEEDAHDHGQRDDRPRPREPGRLVEPREDLGEDVLERREQAADDHVRAFREPLRGNTVWSFA